MKCDLCEKEVEPARAELKLKICFSCAESTVEKIKGRMVYDSKVAGEMEIVNSDTLRLSKGRPLNKFKRSDGW